MRKISSFLIVAGIIGIVGPFFGLGLKSIDTAEDNFGIGLIFLVVGVVLLLISNARKNQGAS